jgi:hypothetical protein
VEASANNWNMAGVWCGPNAATATSSQPGGAIFLPAAGYRSTYQGKLEAPTRPDDIFYWSIEVDVEDMYSADMVWFNSYGKNQYISQPKNSGLNVRCILDTDAAQ